MAEQKTTYTDRLIKKFQTEEQTSFETDEVIKLITEFKLEEDAKRKAKPHIVPLGKYRYKTVKQVAAFDKQYLEWMVRQEFMVKYPEFKAEVLKYL